MDFLAFFVGMVAGIAFFIVIRWFIEDRAFRLMQARAARGSNEKQAASQNRLLEALAEGVSLYQAAKAEGKEPMAIAKEILPGLLFKYPDVALTLTKKFGKGGLEGILQGGLLND